MLKVSNNLKEFAIVTHFVVGFLKISTKDVFIMSHGDCFGFESSDTDVSWLCSWMRVVVSLYFSNLIFSKRPLIGSFMAKSEKSPKTAPNAP